MSCGLVGCPSRGAEEGIDADTIVDCGSGGVHGVPGKLVDVRGGEALLQQTLEARRSEVEARLQVLGLRRERARVWARLNFLGIAPEPSLTARPEASR